MKARVSSLPTRALIGIAAAAVLVYALALWLLVVSPQRAEATGLADDIVAAELRLAEAQAGSRAPVPVTGARVSDVLRLAKAMPSSTDQSGLILELELLGRAAGVEIGSITPREPVLGVGGPTSIPVVVTAEGSYRQIMRFLTRARNLVRIRGGDVHATGRLFTVQVVELSESNTRRFPLLDATITLNSFVYDAPIVPVAPPPSAATGEDPSAEASAARSTP